MATNNPANKTGTALPKRTRIPMSVPKRRLEVSEIQGYHLHWFLTSNVERAINAGYDFVGQKEIETNSFDLAGSSSSGGSTDLGSRVSVPASIGGDSEERLYLMKIPDEFREEDQKAMAEVNERIARSIREGGFQGEGDNSQRYIPEGVRRQMQNLFVPKR